MSPERTGPPPVGPLNSGGGHGLTLSSVAVALIRSGEGVAKPLSATVTMKFGNSPKVDTRVPAIVAWFPVTDRHVIVAALRKTEKGNLGRDGSLRVLA